MDPRGSLAKQLTPINETQVKREIFSDKVRWSGEYGLAGKGTCPEIS